MKAYITGSGAFVPERTVTNEELAERLGLAPEQIFKSSGIRRRRWAEAGTATSNLAAEALRSAIADARLDAGQVDYLLLGTMTPDRFIPGSSPSVQKLLSLGEIPCLDIRAACCNMLYGLQLARALVASGAAHHVALCLAEVQSAWLDLSPASGTISMLFGDGASAVIISGVDAAETSKEEMGGPLEIVDVLLATEGAYIDDLGIRCPGTERGTPVSHEPSAHREDYFARMIGQSVILQASRRMVAASQSLLDRNNLSAGDVRWVVPHQANANLLAQFVRGLRLPAGYDGLVSVIEDFGNTSSASMGLALDALRRSDRIQLSEYLLLPAFGAGFTWGAGLLRRT